MVGQPRLFWQADQVEGVTVVRFKIDRIWKERTAEAIGEDLLALVEAGCRRLVLNFAGVESIGSVMLGKLNALRKRCEAAGGRLVLCGFNPVLAETFEVTKMSRLFTIRGEEKEALQALAAPAG